jgi:hypothetical protein
MSGHIWLNAINVSEENGLGSPNQAPSDLCAFGPQNRVKRVQKNEHDQLVQQQVNHFSKDSSCLVLKAHAHMELEEECAKKN